MLNYLKIIELFENKVSVKEQFYSSIGMTRIGFTNMLKNRSLKVETLEKIADYFQKPISYFFDEVAETVDNIAAEPEAEYSFKGKYYDLLEKYTEALEKINILNNEKDKSTKKANPNIYNT